MGAAAGVAGAEGAAAGAAGAEDAVAGAAGVEDAAVSFVGAPFVVLRRLFALPSEFPPLDFCLLSVFCLMSAILTWKAKKKAVLRAMLRMPEFKIQTQYMK